MGKVYIMWFSYFVFKDVSSLNSVLGFLGICEF